VVGTSAVAAFVQAGKERESCTSVHVGKERTLSADGTSWRWHGFEHDVSPA